MKQLLFILVALQTVFFNSCSQKNDKSAGTAGAKTAENRANEQPKINPWLSDWRGEHLKGRVKAYTDSIYDLTGSVANPGKGVLNRTITEYFYNNGLLMLKITGRVKGREVSNSEDSSVYQYDKSGNVSEREETGHVLSGAVKFNWNRVEKYKYDEKSDLIEIAESKVKDSVVAKGSHIYYKYDERHNRIEQKFYDDKGRPFGDHYEYDGNNILVEATTFSADGPQFGAFYVYNDAGDVTYEYEKKISSPDGHIMDEHFYEYEYDTSGNWTRKTSWLKEFLYEKKVDELSERRITYF
jgi:hypothetical protein